LGEGIALSTVTATVDYFLARTRPRITMTAPPRRASAPVPIAASISGTDLKQLGPIIVEHPPANEVWDAINVTARTARRLRVKFFI
jgi:hypothetical protein